MKNGVNTINNNFTTWLKNNSLTITIQVVGFLLIVLNLWLSTKLAPLAQNIDTLTSRVEATEGTLKEREDEIRTVHVLQSQIVEIKDNIKDIKQSQEKMLNLLIGR